MYPHTQIIIKTISLALENAKRTTTPEIYALCHSQLGDMTLNDFRTEVAKHFKENLLPGFKTKLGRGGGIVRCDGDEIEKSKPTNYSTVSIDVADIPTETTQGFILQITPTIRVTQGDNRNWIIQKKSGEAWTNNGYYPDLKDSLRAIVKKIINNEFKLSEGTIIQLKDSINFIKNMEENMYDMLQKLIDNQNIT